MNPQPERTLLLSKDVDYPMRKFGAAGTYDSLIGILPIAKETLALVLPPGAELMEVPGFPAGSHPLVVTAGFQSNVGSLYARWLPKMSYLEWIFSIPFVRRTRANLAYREPFAHPTRIFVTSVHALIEGRLAGYPKLMARPEFAGTSFLLRDSSGKELISAEWKPYGLLQPPLQFAGFRPNYPILHQPILGTLLGASWLPGVFPLSYFVWELEQGEMQAVQGVWEVATDSIPGLPRGTHSFRGFDDNGIGMARLKCPWIVRGFVPNGALARAARVEDKVQSPSGPSAGG